MLLYVRRSFAFHSFPTRRSSDLALDGREATKEVKQAAEATPGTKPQRAVVRAKQNEARKEKPSVIGRQHQNCIGKRSEEHTSELQSLTNLVCRLLLEKKKKQIKR